MKVDVLNLDGKKVSDVEVGKGFFDEKFDMNLLQSTVVWQQARKRSGTHKVKTKAEVSGGGKKPFRQKGTGNARQGSIRSPLLEGGGVSHGPKPRSYDYALPKKLRKKALRNALSYVFQNKKLMVVEDLKSESGKTKEVALKFKKLGLKKSLIFDDKVNDLFKRACKNLKNFKCLDVEGLNVYDILKFDHVIVTKKSLEKIKKRCGV